MKLIVISNSKNIENEPQIVTRLFEEGLESFHLRKNNMSTRGMRRFLDAIPIQFHNRIFIHSHHKLALHYNIKGIHLRSTHKSRKWKTWLTVRLLKFMRPHLQLTTSFKALGDLYQTEHDYKYDYIFLSPVFDSHSSKFQGGFSEYSLKMAIEKTNHKIIARGGISTLVIEKANQIGFDGVAVYSTLWGHANPEEEFKRVIEKFQELNIPVE